MTSLQKIVQRFADASTGTGIGAQSDVVDVFLYEGDASAEADLDTDADSIWTWTYTITGSSAAGYVLNAGPVYWLGSYSGRVRAGSSKSFPQVGANSIGELVYAWRAWGNGVFAGAVTGDMAVTAVGGQRKTSVAAGLYNLNGIWVHNDTARQLDHAVANATNPRIDRVILEQILTAGDTEGKTTLKVLTGTAAASPAAPALTNDATTKQVSLSQVRINALSATITSVTDERTYTLTNDAHNPTLDTTAITAPGATGISSTSGASLAALEQTPTLVSGVWYTCEVEAELAVDGNATVISIAPFINGTSNAATYQAAPAITTGLVNVSNFHSDRVQGTGAAITVGVLAKRSNSSNTPSYYSGSTHVICLPES